MTIYVLIWEDRHSDDEIELYSNLDTALTRADEIIDSNREEGYDYTQLDEDYHLTPAMIKDGWRYNKVYSVEGDGVRIEEKELQ